VDTNDSPLVDVMDCRGSTLPLGQRFIWRFMLHLRP